MSLKRRAFLGFAALSGLGLSYAAKAFHILDQPSSQEVSADDPEAIAQRPRNTSQTPLLRFVAVADTGTGASGQYAVARAMTRYHEKFPYDLVVLAGDNIYNNGEIEKIQAVFERPYQTLLKKGVKFHACLGNHDIRTDNGVPQTLYPGFNMGGKRYYTFRRNNVQFFALDTNSNADWEPQMAWLEQELSRSNAMTKIVFGHHQIYSSGHYGINQAFIKRFTPLFQKYKVPLYINGHDHNYERTKPIAGTSYLICGGGAGTRPVGRSPWTTSSGSLLSFAAVEVYHDRLRFQGINTQHQVFDQGEVLFT